MMIKNLLEEIILYLQTGGRQTGNTTMLVNAVKNRDAYLVARESHAKEMGLSPCQIMTLSKIENGGLKGLRANLVFDNYAIYEILLYARREINRLEQENAQLKNKINCAK